MAELGSAREEFERKCRRAARALDGGEPAKARRLYEKALDLEDDSTTDDERLIVRESLAECCYATGKFEAAEAFFRDALALSADRIAAYGPDHEISVRIRYGLARGLSEADNKHPSGVAKLEEAVQLYRQNARLLAKVSGYDNDLTHNRSSLAFCLGELAKRYTDKDAANALRTEAADIYSDLLQAMQAVDSIPEESRMIEIRHNYASMLYDMHRYQEAKEEFLHNEQALKGLSVEQRGGMEVVVQETDSYLEACSEATNDLELSLRRRTTDPLSRRQTKESREKAHGSPGITDEGDPFAALVPRSHRALVRSTLEVPNSSTQLRRPKSQEPSSTTTDRGGQTGRPKSASDAADSPNRGSRRRGRTISPRPRSPTRGELFESGEFT